MDLEIWGVFVLFFTLTAYWIYTVEFIGIAYNSIKMAYKRYKLFSNMARLGNLSIFRLVLATSKFILKSCWISMLQCINHTLTKHGRYYHVSFIINGELYKLIIRPRKGPRDIIFINDSESEDVTTKVMPYILGFESVQKISPEILGLNEIEIYKDSSEEPCRFKNIEPIITKA